MEPGSRQAVGRHSRSIPMAEKSFENFLNQRRQVASAFVNGDPGPLSEISTSTDPATIFGPNGRTAQGASHVLEINEIGAHRFHGGTTDLEVLHSGESGDLAYWTGIQRASVRVEGQHDATPMSLRVTEI